jgi:NADH-quinone oxidoreductase subunit L
MFFAAGVGAYQAAMFHLFTHAFFKALLFLGAGSVIHGMHHQQDMRQMGGLSKTLPVTYSVMMIGTIAITGLGLPMTQLGFAGFFSKDMIIESAFVASQTSAGQFAFWMGIAAAMLTSFYSWRLIAMTFYGKKHWDHSHDHSHGNDAHNNGHDDHKPHESPWVMLIPIIILAFGAVFAGIAFAPYFIGDHNVQFWGDAIHNAKTNHILHDAHEIKEYWVKFAPLVVTLIGMILAWFFYIYKPSLPKKMADQKGPLYTFLYNKWYFDEIYDFVFVAWTALKSAQNLVKTQTGYVYHYAFFMFLGVVGLLSAVWLGWIG